MNKRIDAMDAKFENKFIEMNKNFNDLKLNLDWQFEITTRSIIEKQRDDSFSKCRVVRNFQDFHYYFYEICTKRMMRFLFIENNFNLIDSLNVVCEKESCPNLDKKNLNEKLFFLYSKYRNKKQGIIPSDENESKSFEINIQGMIDLIQEEYIIIEIGEVKLTANRDSIKMAKIQLHPVLYLLYYLLENVKNKRIDCYGNIYYGRENTYVVDHEEDDIFYRFQKITGDLNKYKTNYNNY